jgi:flagellar biosynthetic protein FliQ
MNDTMVIELARRTMLLTLMLAGPLLTVALVVGVIVSLFQAVTQIQEQTVSFVVKLAAVGAVFLLGMHWMIQVAVQYTLELFHGLPGMVS